MAFFCETLDRRVVPNWRSFDATVAIGEMEYQKNMQHVPFDLREYEYEWKENKSLLYASEFVNAAVANGILDNSSARDAAEFVLQNSDKATEAQKLIALLETKRLSESKFKAIFIIFTACFD